MGIEVKDDDRQYQIRKITADLLMKDEVFCGAHEFWLNRRGERPLVMKRNDDDTCGGFVGYADTAWEAAELIYQAAKVIKEFYPGEKSDG